MTVGTVSGLQNPTTQLAENASRVGDKSKGGETVVLVKWNPACMSYM